MQHLARALGQKDLPEVKPILELNPNHELVRKLQGLEEGELLNDASHLLLEQALIQEGAELKNPAEFARRLTRVLARAV
jgi:molecular chaperone HtpG